MPCDERSQDHLLIYHRDLNCARLPSMLFIILAQACLRYRKWSVSLESVVNRLFLRLYSFPQMLHDLPQDVNVLSKEETELWPDSLHVHAREFNGISMDCTDRSYPMLMITCRWCKKEKSCEHFEQYRKAYGYHIACNDCRQLYCRFCGHSFKSKCRAADPPHYAVCEANECKRRSAIKPRSCCNASCIHHKSKSVEWENYRDDDTVSVDVL